MRFYKPDSPWLTKYDAEISSIAFPARAVSGQPVRCLAPSVHCVERKSRRERVMESRGGCTSMLQESEAGGVQQCPSPSHHGWLALPGISWLVPAGIPSWKWELPQWHCCPTMCWGPGSEFGYTNHNLGFLLRLLHLQGNSGISWAVMGFGDSLSSPLEGSGFMPPVCLKLGGMRAQETPKSSGWKNTLTKKSKGEKKGF